VPECAKVDALMTIGSPIGADVIAPAEKEIVN
jgi:hypothetical protein